MANTFELISSVTVGAGGAASIDFTSIPATYTDLVLKLSSRINTTTTNVLISLNGSATSFTDKVLYGTGSTVGTTSYARFAAYGSQSSDTSNTFGNSEIYIPNYASSNNKSFSSDGVSENNATAANAMINAGLWSNSSAVTSISLSPDSGSFLQYSTAYLYGVKNA